MLRRRALLAAPGLLFAPHARAQQRPLLQKILSVFKKEKTSFRELIINSEPLEKRVALLIDGVARSMAEDFFRKFDEELQRRHPAPAATESEAGGGQPATADSQKSSKSLPTAAWVAGGVVVLLVLWWLLGK